VDFTKFVFAFILRDIKLNRKEKTMTIKRRLFISNIRMVFITFLAFGLAGRIIMFLIPGTWRIDPEVISQFRNTSSQDIRIAIWFLVFALSIILISIINTFLTHRMTRHIVKPLVPLNEGVRQIHDNNYALNMPPVVLP
jgi:hypothetical protein